MKVYYVTCPKCNFRYYVGYKLISIKGFPTICPRCHHEYPLEQSKTGVNPVRKDWSSTPTLS